MEYHFSFCSEEKESFAPGQLLGHWLDSESLLSYSHRCVTINVKMSTKRNNADFYKQSKNIYYAENIPILTQNRPAKCLTHQKSSGL